MLVTKANLRNVVLSLKEEKRLAVDTETTGLEVYGADTLFSIIIASSKESYYFNFKKYPGLDDELVLSKKEHLPELEFIFEDEDKLFFLHNAKFDLAILRKDGLEIKGNIHDTEVVARICYNQHFQYNLAACAERIGLKKSGAVDEYIEAHSLYTKIKNADGKNVKLLHFDKVPFEIISSYGMQDGRVTYDLGEHQLAELDLMASKVDAIYGHVVHYCYKNERKLTRVCFEMEDRGIKINRDYCSKAYSFELSEVKEATLEFERLSGREFIDSGKALSAAFTDAGETYPRTEKGNPSFTAEVLEGFDSPLAKCVLKYRHALKKANTYYKNFLTMADKKDLLHANIRQAGTATLRFSYSEPNLQNLPKSEDEDTLDPYPVRRSFMPRSSDVCFVMIDYKAMEFAMLLDIAGEKNVIKRILEENLDVHQATADQMRVSRSEAKTLNFLLLYGGGTDLLAKKLGVTKIEAQILKAKYFGALPRVAKLTREISNKAAFRGWVKDWAGFHYHFPNQQFAYKAPNHLIQGGCAKVVRQAMVECEEYLYNKRSKLIINIHDELLFEIHKDELEVTKDLSKIMSSVYKANHLPLTCTVAHSWVSWADKIKGEPRNERSRSLREEVLVL